MFVKIDASLERNRIYNRKSATVSMALIHYLHTNIMHLCIVTELEANYHHHPKMIADDYRWWWWWSMMMMTMMMIIRQHLHKARHGLIQYLDSLYYCLLPACCFASLLLDCSTTIIRCSHRSFDLSVCVSRLVSRTPIYNLSRTAGHHHRMTERWWWWWWPGWLRLEIACNV